MSSNFWRALGTLIDVIEDNSPREIVIVEEPRPRREVVVISTGSYREVYPMIKYEVFDDAKVEKATKCFEANRAVNLDDLVKCLEAMSFDSGRSDLCRALRHPISKMSYFERMEIADTFVFPSSVPAFIND